MEDATSDNEESTNNQPKYKGKGKGIGKGKSNRLVDCPNIEKSGTPKVKTKRVKQKSYIQAPKLKENTIRPEISNEPQKVESNVNHTKNYNAQLINCSREDPLMADIVWRSVLPNEERIPRLNY